MRPPRALAERRGSAYVAARLELLEREATIRECLTVQELHEVDAPALQKAIREARQQGCEALALLAQAEAKMEEWNAWQAKLAELRKGVHTFLVVNPDGFVNVRTEPSGAGAIVCKKEPGQILRGTIEGAWMKLSEEMGFMLMAKPDGTALLERFQGDAPAEIGESGSQVWVTKLLAFDTISREALTFLAPEHRSEDLEFIAPIDIPAKMLKLGHRLYHEGSLPGNPTWELEENPEFLESVSLWGEAIEAKSCMGFNKSLQKARTLAEEAYEQMGNLMPRLAALRWTCGLAWIAARSDGINACSTGNCLGTMSPKVSDACSREGKKAIFAFLRALCKEYAVLTIFDFDLMGHGVWHDGVREPLSRRAKEEWYRRAIEYDIIKMCHQAVQVPPFDINASQPTLTLVQPYLTPAWILPPPEAARHILKKHGWFADYAQPEIEDLHTKALIRGSVLHIERPQDYEHDYTDPETIEKVQRGEDLGKGPQDDGKPGAIHGSIALLYAALCDQERVTNLHFYAGLLDLEGFFEAFVQYGPELSTLELGGAKESLTEEILEHIADKGRKMQILDLSECGFRGDIIETLVGVVERLPMLKHIDIADNHMDAESLLHFVAALAERRIDIPSVRLDGNPIGDPVEFRNEVAAVLAGRGEQCIAGGELVLHLDDDMMRWYPVPKEGVLAWQLRDESQQPPRAMAVKEVKQMATTEKRRLDKYETSDPAAETSGGRDWLDRQRTVNDKIFSSTMLELYKKEIDHRIAVKDEKEAKAAEEEAVQEVVRETQRAARKATMAAAEH